MALDCVVAAAVVFFVFVFVMANVVVVVDFVWIVEFTRVLYLG